MNNTACYLLFPQLRKKETDIATLNETDVSNAEEMVSTLKPMKDATTLMSQEKNPTVYLIAPVHTKLLQNTEPTQKIRHWSGILKRPSTMTSAVDTPVRQRKAFSILLLPLTPVSRPYLSFLQEREQTYGKVIAEAASLEVNLSFYSI